MDANLGLILMGTRMFTESDWDVATAVVILAIAITAVTVICAMRGSRIRVQALHRQREQAWQDQRGRLQHELDQTLERLKFQRRHFESMVRSYERTVEQCEQTIKAYEQQAQSKADDELRAQLEALRQQGHVGQA